MAVITISRECGSGGEAISQQVAERIGYSYFDKEILADVAEIAHASEEAIATYDERDEHGFLHFLKKVFTPRYMPTPDLLLYTPEFYIEWQHESFGEETREIDQEEVIEFFREVIERLWQRGNVVIVGRASHKILSDKTNTLHVRFIAPIRFRAQAVADQNEISYEDALNIVRKNDRQSFGKTIANDPAI